MLTKILVNKPIRVWDQYLQQAVFAARIRVHSGLERSPYYLLYGKHPRLPIDDNGLQPLLITRWDESQVVTRVSKLQHVRMEANLKLLVKAEKARKVRVDRVRIRPLTTSSWVLIRAEERHKLEARWFGPYKVLKAFPLGTYCLAQLDGKILRHLING